MEIKSLSKKEQYNLCIYLYNSIKMPLRFFDGTRQIFSLPQGEQILSLAHLTPNMISLTQTLSYYETKDSVFWGMVKVKGSDFSLVIGPVQAGSAHTIQLDFTDNLLFINYLFNNENFSREDFFSYQKKITDISSVETYFENQYFSNDTPESLLKEEEILKYIEKGDVHAVRDYLISPHYIYNAESNPTSIESRKQIGYYSVALFSESAKKAGLPLKKCADITLNYYQTIDKCTYMEELDLIIGHSAMHFTGEVQNLIIPANINHSIFRCTQYIRQNVYTKITIDDIADYLGFSRSHTCKLFKDNLGFSIGAFIRRAKLEESKNLLTYSDKSIAEISSVLCFTDQSHFQNAFKKAFGLTPLQYRNKK